MRGRSFLLAVLVGGLTAVAAPAASAGVLDQQQAVVSTQAAILGPGSGCCLPISRAQTFTPALSGVLDQVDLNLGNESADPGPLTVEIRDVGSGGAPGSTVLASASVPAAAVPAAGSDTFVAVPFASAATVLAGSRYAIVAYAGGADKYVWGLGPGDLYAGGALFATFSSPPTTWTGPFGDHAFKTYVAYPFTGFFSPVDNPPTVNAAKAGSSVPVKFRLGGDRGLGVLAVGYPQSQEFNCNTDAPVDPIEETSTANGGLTYNALTDQYTYVWKTSKSWSGQCRTLSVKLDDNTEPHTANFQFR